MKPIVAILLILLCSANLSVIGQEEGPWLLDYQDAVESATSEDKPLLIVFTGTDWIEICQIFHDEILTAPEFYEPVSERFVLLRLEYPEGNRLPKEKATQLQLLKDAYRVRGFPTVMMTDPKGRPFGINGYQPVTPDAYAKQVLSIADTGEKTLSNLKEAEALEGMDKAKKIIEGIPVLPGNLAARYFQDEMRQVIQLDPEDTLGHSKEYRGLLLDVKYSSEMQRLAKDVQWGKMLALSKSYIEEGKLTGLRLQKVLLNMADIQNRQANLPARVNSLLNVMKIDPESHYGKEAERQLRALRAKKLQEELAPKEQ